jgi:hypothetical protein
MNRARWIGLGVLLGATVGFARQNLDVYFAGSEVMYSRMDVSNSSGFYEGGIGWNLEGRYFKGQVGFGAGSFRSDICYAGNVTLGPRLTVVPHRLDLNLGAGVGYFGYVKETFAPSIVNGEFKHTLPLHAGMEAVLFERVSLSWMKFFGEALDWKLKAGIQVIQW